MSGPTLNVRSGLLAVDAPEPREVADLARSVLLTTGPASKRIVVDRLERLLRWRWDTPDLRDHARRFVGQLAFLGDAVARGGDVAPAPLRIVSLAKELHVLLGAVPTEQLGLPWTVAAPFLRYVNVEAPPGELAEVAGRWRGRHVPDAELWLQSGSTDAAWLQEETARLSASEASHDPHPSEEPYLYDPLRPKGYQEGRWKRLPQADGRSGLLMLRLGRGRRFAWLPEGRGLDQAVAVSGALARRLQYALDRQAGTSLRAQMTEVGDRTSLTLFSSLPSSERRLLGLARNGESGDPFPRTCEFDRPVGLVVARLLRDRLGLKVD